MLKIVTHIICSVFLIRIFINFYLVRYFNVKNLEIAFRKIAPVNFH